MRLLAALLLGLISRIASLRLGYRHHALRMAIKDVCMPALSSTMTEGKIVSWCKKVGDKVSAGAYASQPRSLQADECASL